MTNVPPNNKSGEEWAVEFREKFEDLENLTNITDTSQVKAFILKPRQEAIAGERKEFREELGKYNATLLNVLQPYARKFASRHSLQ